MDRTNERMRPRKTCYKAVKTVSTWLNLEIETTKDYDKWLKVVLEKIHQTHTSTKNTKNKQ